MQAADLFIFERLLTLPFTRYCGGRKISWRALPRCTGIYFFLAGTIPLYIGASTVLNTRVHKHNKLEDMDRYWLPIYQEVRLYYACFAQYWTRYQLGSLEECLIRRYKPLLNRDADRCSYRPLAALWQAWKDEDMPVTFPQDKKKTSSPEEAPHA